MSLPTGTISDNAAGPKKATGDVGSMEQHSLPDQIAADKYLKANSAMSGSTLPIKMLKISQPGAV